MERDYAPGANRGHEEVCNAGGHSTSPRVEPPPKPDKAAMRTALDAMFAHDDVIELRALHKGRKHTYAGYFDSDHREALVNEAARLNASGAAVYVVLNRIDPQLLGRYCNRIEDCAKETVTDKDVIRRRWLLIDFDPMRPVNTSATDVQVAAARESARACYQALNSEGWPRPMSAESGNGMHLVYPLDLPNDAESTALIKGALAGLAARFDTDLVKIDQSVFNAGRIVKLYGTVSSKGDHTLNTPWRLSRLVSGTDRSVTITAGQLRALHPKGNGVDPKAGNAWGRFDLPAFLARLGIAYDRDIHEGADRYKLEHCPFNPEHGRGEAAIFEQSGGRFGFKCQHDSCLDKHWQDVRALVDGPREARASTADAKAPAGGNGAEACESRVIVARGDTLSVKPPRWLWDGWLAHRKLHLVAGAIGAGKTTVAIGLAAVVTTGGLWPDGTKCKAGDVLFWSDEDDPEDTLLPRFLAAGGDPRRIHFVTGTVDRDGARHFDPATDIPALVAAGRNITDLELVIVDPVVTVVAGDSHKNTEVRRALRPLVGLASDLDSAVLGVSHHTKGTAGRDPVERITGSLAFGALPRVTMAAARDGTDPERRIFCRTKSNIGPDNGGWEYRLDLADVPGAKGVRVVRARWGKWLEGSAKDLLAGAEASGDPDPEQRSKLDDAMDWLGKLLKEGPVDSKEIRAAAKQSGVAWTTLERAKPLLGVKAIKMAYAGGWRWCLPEHDDGPEDDLPPSNTDGLGGLGKQTPLKASPGAGLPKTANL